MNVIKKYWNQVYQYILLLTPLACMCAGVIYTIRKLSGWHPDTPWFLVLLFDTSQIIYLLICLRFINHKKKHHYYSQKDIFKIKLFLTIALFIQYNFIVHCFPSADTWSCTFIFMGFIAFLFDFKLTLIHVSGYTVFLLIGHFLYLEKLMPHFSGTKEEILPLRIIIYFLTSLSIILITYFVEKFLIEQQAEENENMLYNTHRVTKNLVKNNEDKNVVFTINNIDKVPFSDLEQIMSNIEREDKFNYEYLEVVEEKVKSKTK